MRDYEYAIYRDTIMLIVKMKLISALERGGVEFCSHVV